MADENENAIETAKDELREEQERIEAAEAVARAEGEAAANAINSIDAQFSELRERIARMESENARVTGELIARIAELETAFSELETEVEEIPDEMTEAASVEAALAVETPPTETIVETSPEPEAPHKRKRSFIPHIF